VFCDGCTVLSTWDVEQRTGNR